ncbi:hypothetical protein V2J09_008624 [Rumex salicifolius]
MRGIHNPHSGFWSSSPRLFPLLGECRWLWRTIGRRAAQFADGGASLFADGGAALFANGEQSEQL